jgi:hypothetical protein
VPNTIGFLHGMNGDENRRGVSIGRKDDLLGFPYLSGMVGNEIFDEAVYVGGRNTSFGAINCAGA